MRRDAWWLQPITFIAVIVVCFGYLTWAAFQNDFYTVAGTGYLSPAYSPILFTDRPGEESWFGARPGFWPAFLPFSPALLILPFPGIFRFTCYYYRGAYYKAFWADPPNCAVGEPRKGYLGENSLPLILQNVHRYALYIAVIFVFILSHDVWKALWFGTGEAREFGIGVGTLILAANTVAIGAYTLGCHAMRHIVGGFSDTLSGKPIRKAAYDCSSCLNRWHMKWAFISLFTVSFADLYVRLCSMGIWHDIRLI